MSLGTPSPTGAPPTDSGNLTVPTPDVGLRRLQKVAEVELAGQRLHLGKNGGFHLVMPRTDVWGHPSGTELTVHQWLDLDRPLHEPARKRIQALLDAYGEALVKRQEAVSE